MKDDIILIKQNYYNGYQSINLNCLHYLILAVDSLYLKILTWETKIKLSLFLQTFMFKLLYIILLI